MSTATTVERPSVRSIFPVQRRLTLEMLQRFGPLAVESFPRAWPLEREDQRAIVHELAASGAVTMVPDTRVPGRMLARLTDQGSRLLRQMDDQAMRALVDDGAGTEGLVDER